MDALIRQAVDGMRKNGFEVVEVRTAAEARDCLLARIASGQDVGVGGSVSIREIDVLPALEAKGCRVYSHWGVTDRETQADIQRRAREAACYLSSVNAVTRTGKLVLIDGRGNRVGAICDGPREIYLVISHSKVVDGGINTTVARIKQNACPQNCRRLGLQTACALTGKCGGDECTEASICNLTLVVDRVPRGRHITVVLVEEALGY